MKVTTLACDYCTAVVPAVASRRLADGSGAKSGLEIDLCKRHLAELLRAFTPRNRSKLQGRMGRAKKLPGERLEGIERKRAADRDRKRKQAAAKGGWPKKKKVCPPGSRKGVGGRKKGVPQRNWSDRQTTVMALLPAMGTMETQELHRQVAGVVDSHRMPIGAVKETIRQLKAKGLMVQHGTRRHARYGRAGGRAEAVG